MRPLVRPSDIKKEPTQPYLQGQIGNLFGAGDVLLQRVPQGSIGIHKIKQYKAESAVSASIDFHRLTRKETLGETLARPLVNYIIILVNLVNRLVNDENKKDPPTISADGFLLWICSDLKCGLNHNCNHTVTLA